MNARGNITCLAVWLLISQLTTPFAHVHPGDPGHHHSNGFSHAHLAVHHHEQAHQDDAGEWEDLDENEQAVWLDWAPTEQSRVEIEASATVALFDLVPPILVAGAPIELTPRSHDPPSNRLLPPRSPPV
jgi:hypothetical protein